MAVKVNKPFGAADVVALTATGAQAIEVNSAYTHIDGVTVEATGNRTINLTIGAQVSVGDKVFVASKTNGTQTTTFGTGITAPVITGIAGKTFTQGFEFDGTAFLPVGLQVQID